MFEFNLLAIIPTDYSENVNAFLILIKRVLSLMGSFIIVLGALYAVYRFLVQLFESSVKHQVFKFDRIRISLGRAIILGLEFIIAADVVETTTAPDYYSLGILGFVVLIRTFANYSLNKDLTDLIRQEKEQQLITEPQVVSHSENPHGDDDLE